MKTGSIFGIASIGLIFAGCLVVTEAAQPLPIRQAMAFLVTQSGHGTVWNAKSAIVADVTCNGKPDTIIVGRRHRAVLIGVVSESEQGKPKTPIIVEFPTNHPIGQNAFCGTDVHIEKERLVCKTGDGVPLAGCRPVRGCSAFRADDGECDSFHFYWDSKRKALTWWRL